MSINTPAGQPGLSPRSRFRKAIWLLLLPALAAVHTGDAKVTPDPATQEQQGDPFKGIKIVPDDTPKKPEKLHQPEQKKRPTDSQPERIMHLPEPSKYA